MDYLLSVFFNSATGDRDYTPNEHASFEHARDKYYRPWKWHWRTSEGPGWHEDGNQILKIKVVEAALGKMTVRVWNRDDSTTTILKAELLIEVTDGGAQADIGKVFSAYKDRDPFNNVQVGSLCGKKKYRIDLSNVPTEGISNADNGDQMMRSWDVVDLFFASKPAEYKVNLTLFVRFGNLDDRIFILDPETDPGVADFVISLQ